MMTRMAQAGAESKAMARVDGAAPRLLRIEEVARQLAVSRSMAWKLIAAGELRAVRIGRAVRVRPTDLEAFLGRAAGEG
jgi:excisionase family DNA binding protein